MRMRMRMRMIMRMVMRMSLRGQVPVVVFVSDHIFLVT